MDDVRMKENPEERSEDGGNVTEINQDQGIEYSNEFQNQPYGKEIKRHGQTVVGKHHQETVPVIQILFLR
tara:strand:- start:192 stop:401 length:210 start_codon:yes stop_codon:yes gene_type:complete